MEEMRNLQLKHSHTKIKTDKKQKKEFNNFLKRDQKNGKKKRKEPMKQQPKCPKNAWEKQYYFI